MDETVTNLEPPQNSIRELDEGECWSLAATVPVGRLAWTGPTGPTVVPVNFTVDGTSVRVRTAAYSALARECDDSPVAFEVDQIDPTTRTGWSVLMRGRAHVDYRDSGGTSPQVWASGSRALHVSVAVAQITGRKITPS